MSVNTILINDISLKRANAYVAKRIGYYKDKCDIDYSPLSSMKEDDFNLLLASKKTSNFSIFLSHRSKDKNIIAKLYYFLEKKLGYKVYVDWIVDSQLKRRIVTKKNSRVLKIRLRNSNSFLLAKTKGFRKSKWLIWETGYFEALGRKMGQLELGSKKISGMEFLESCQEIYLAKDGIYLVQDKDSDNGGTLLW